MLSRWKRLYVKQRSYFSRKVNVARLCFANVWDICVSITHLFRYLKTVKLSREIALMKWPLGLRWSPTASVSTHRGGREYNRALQLTDLVALCEAFQTIPLWGQIVIKKLLNCSKSLRGNVKQSGRSVNWCLLVTVGIFSLTEVQVG